MRKQSVIVLVLLGLSGVLMIHALSMKEVYVKEKMIEEVKEKEVMVSIHRTSGSVDVKPLEEYVMGVVASEMPVSFELEALKAQSVASRTYVFQRLLEVDDTTSSQVYQDEAMLKERWKDAYEENWAKIKEAVMSTKGEVLLYDGGYITAAFYSSSCGNSNNAGEYWQKDVPYLRSVPSHWEESLQENFIVKKVVSGEQFMTLFEGASGTPRIQYYDSGYVKEMCVGEICLSGRKVRESLELRSSSFEVTQEGSDIIFTTKGSGHGIGMSQYGAQGMAKEGKTYQEILQYYYQGVKIEKAHV